MTADWSMICTTDKVLLTASLNGLAFVSARNSNEIAGNSNWDYSLMEETTGLYKCQAHSDYGEAQSSAMVKLEHSG